MFYNDHYILYFLHILFALYPRDIFLSYVHAGGGGAYYPVSDIQRNLMFEDEEDVLAFLDHCGLEVG